MSNKVTRLYPKEAAKDPDLVLEQAIGDYQDVLVLGWLKDDTLCCRSNLSLSTAEALHLMELFKKDLLTGEDE